MFASDDALIGNGQTYSSFYIFIPTFLHCVLQTIYEVASVERIKLKIIIEVIILRQENEGKFWFIISAPFKTPATGIKIDSTSELSVRDVIIESKETITTMKVSSFKHSRQKGWKGTSLRE